MLEFDLGKLGKGDWMADESWNYKVKGLHKPFEQIFEGVGVNNVIWRKLFQRKSSVKALRQEYVWETIGYTSNFEGTSRSLGRCWLFLRQAGEKLQYFEHRYDMIRITIMEENYIAERAVICYLQTDVTRPFLRWDGGGSNQTQRASVHSAVTLEVATMCVNFSSNWAKPE